MYWRDIIYLYQIDDPTKTPTYPSGPGIYFAARKILNRAALLHDIEVYFDKMMESKQFGYCYFSHTDDIYPDAQLRALNFNAIQCGHVFWFRFFDGEGWPNIFQPMTGRMTQRFRDFVADKDLKVYAKNPPPRGLKTFGPPLDKPATISSSPLHRAINARGGQYGLYVPQ